jgi:hypothetical protein
MVSIPNDLGERTLIPNDFGVKDGTPISNKSTLLTEIDTAISRKSPSVEYIVILPFSYVGHTIFGFRLGFNYNIFGHSAVRYRLPKDDGSVEDIVMNIEGYQEPNLNGLVKFYPAEEYIAGMSSHQGGFYNRHMLTVAYDNVSDENIKKMHQYFLDLDKKSLTGHSKFDIVLGPILNKINMFFPSVVERGNCAKWTSEGLKKAGLIKHTHIWPKNLWITLFENSNEKPKPSVVLYKRITTCPQRYGDNTSEVGSYTAPFDLIRSWTYRDPKKFADCTVEVPDNDIKAIINVNKNPLYPSQTRNIMNHPAFIIGSTIVTAGLTFRYGKRIKTSFINNIWRRRKQNISD